MTGFLHCALYIYYTPNQKQIIFLYSFFSVRVDKKRKDVTVGKSTFTFNFFYPNNIVIKKKNNNNKLSL